MDPSWRQRSRWMRSGLLESPSLRGQRKHCGWSSSGVSGLSLENKGVAAICVMGVPLCWCACTRWRGHVIGHHSTIYSVVFLDFVLSLGCLGGQVCVTMATGEWWIRVSVLWR